MSSTAPAHPSFLESLDRRRVDLEFFEDLPSQSQMANKKKSPLKKLRKFLKSDPQKKKEKLAEDPLDKSRLNFNPLFKEGEMLDLSQDLSQDLRLEGTQRNVTTR